MQAPEPSHTSSVVASPSSMHGMLADLGARALHEPVSAMQPALASRQSVAEGQVTPAHLGVPVHMPAPLH